MVSIIATVAAALAAALHVAIFVMESVQWRSPRIWRRFGLRDQAAAETTRDLAYNQGFYNLFLAIGVVVGLAMFWAGGAGSGAAAAGRAVTLFGLGSMLAAAVVLTTTGRRYLRAAVIQGILPLIGVVLFLPLFS
ncbi:DUF1304 domain-containing protein [Microbacterium sp.]|uniref:DUF1304 domain-containing protein n=1 Tax=Microbacterium sp. TaxID=51671 RepID=UPI003A8C04F8